MTQLPQRTAGQAAGQSNNRSEIVTALRDWVIRISDRDVASSLTPDTGLIAERIVTSVQILELILFIESLAGRPVRADQLVHGAFADLNAVYRTFFEGATS